MKKTTLILFLFTILLYSCDDRDKNERVYNAIVLGKGMDCGETYLIEFDNNVSELPENSFDNVYYAINLPEEYKIEGKEIYVEFRIPENDEIMVCTFLGPTFPQIYITKTE